MTRALPRRGERSSTPVRSSRCSRVTACRATGPSSRAAGCGSTQPRRRSSAARADRPCCPVTARKAALIAAVRGEGTTERMPLKRPPLSATEIKLLEDWIDQGAKHADGEKPGIAPSQTHWAFVPARRPRRQTSHDRAGHAIRSIVSFRLGSTAPGSPRLRKLTVRHCCGERPSTWSVYLPRRRRSTHSRPTNPPALRTRRRSVAGLAALWRAWARPWLDQARYADSNGYNIDAPVRSGSIAIGLSTPSTPTCRLTGSPSTRSPVI